MDKEGFLDVIRKQYGEKISAALLHCEHGVNGEVDYPKLRESLAKLQKSAKAEGLTPAEFEDLVESSLPEEVWEQLGHSHKVA